MKPHGFHAKSLALAAALLSPCLNARAQQAAATPAQASADAARVARLVGLAKVWGAVKYFRPYPAYREVDRDGALVEAMPKVRTAKTPQEYRAALNRMPAALGDAATRAAVEAKAEPAPPARAPAGEPVRTENGVLFIDAMRIAGTGAKDNTALRVLLGKAIESAASAKAVVIDARGAGRPDGFAAYIFADVLRQDLPQPPGSDVTLGYSRHRLHNVRRAGGRRPQRIGIRPHVEAAPTVAGVAAGRDEVLEAAVRHLQERSRK